MKIKKVVFFVDDRMDNHNNLKADMGDKVDIISARSLNEAKSLFAQSGHLVDLVVMDGCVDGREIDTIPLVREIRETFTGPMIANSMSSNYNRQLRSAGCDYEIGREYLHEQILRILGA